MVSLPTGKNTLFVLHNSFEEFEDIIGNARQSLHCKSGIVCATLIFGLNLFVAKIKNKQLNEYVLYMCASYGEKNLRSRIKNKQIF